jgi:hypothetical protein
MANVHIRREINRSEGDAVSGFGDLEDIPQTLCTFH